MMTGPRLIWRGPVMNHKTTFILALLAALTFWGLWLAFMGRTDTSQWVFWGCAQILPVVYILLAVWGGAGHSSDELDLSDKPEFQSSTQLERNSVV
jgi:hypothetical protein